MEGCPTEKTGFGRAAHQSCASAGAQRDAKREVAEAPGAMERHGGGRWKRGGGNQRGTASRQWMRSGLCDTFPIRMARIWTLRLTFWIALNETLVSPQAHPSFAIVLSRQPYQTASQSLDSATAHPRRVAKSRSWPSPDRPGRAPRSPWQDRPTTGGPPSHRTPKNSRGRHAREDTVRLVVGEELHAHAVKGGDGNRRGHLPSPNRSSTPTAQRRKAPARDVSA